MHLNIIIESFCTDRALHERLSLEAMSSKGTLLLNIHISHPLGKHLKIIGIGGLYIVATALDFQSLDIQSLYATVISVNNHIKTFIM